MLRFIASTFATRFLSAIIFFGINILLAQFLGEAGKGQASLFIANMALIVLMNELIGGSAIVYLAPRLPKWKLLLPSYLWLAMLCIGLSYPVMAFTSLPNHWWGHLAVLTFLQGLLGMHQYWLTGIKKINQQNLLFILRAIIVLACLLLLFTSKTAQLTHFFHAMYIGAGACLLLSFFFVFKYTTKPTQNATFKDALKALVNYGLWVQAANLIQFFNYRLAYYYLDIFTDEAQIGIYSVAMHFVEAVWIISRSAALVQYSYIANSQDDKGDQLMSQRIFFYGGLITIILSLGLLIIPEKLFVLLFGSTGFGQVKWLLFLLLPGIIAISLNNAIANYFSGKSWFKLNAFASAFGLIFTIIIGYFLVKNYAITGAAITASLSYCATLLFSAYLWKQKVKQALFAIPPIAKDIRQLIEKANSKQ